MNLGNNWQLWNAELGAVWAEMISRQRLDSLGTVVEIGPGFSDKLARGWAALNFSGRMLLVEPNPEARHWAYAQYCQLLPEAEVSVISVPIPRVEGFPSVPVDVLVGNHILDDLFLNAALAPEMSNSIFTDMSPGAECAPPFTQAWQTLLAQPARLEQLAQQITTELVTYVLRLRPRLLLLNQYPSWRHQGEGLAHIHLQAVRLMHLIARLLSTVGFKIRLQPGSLPAMRWLIAARPLANAASISTPVLCGAAEDQQ